MPEVTDLQKVAQYAKSSGAPSDVYNAACRLLDEYAELAEAKAAIERVRVLCRLKQAQAERAFTRMLSGKPFPAEVRVEAVLAALDGVHSPTAAPTPMSAATEENGS